ncbi:pyridoxal phosphate-dependent aminotransferase [Phaeovulum vinaykumarii]|uniref:Histidinol-phosphate aminotransferase n=1 Tax=Phaeovulum vinaykumarii TaxID=407234 RepID=A0A1N7JTY0_9RHOB|nr:pyridoxal phosphate-dependent aminotransferase [Phaeovulum vinaykumarii]SIS52775.1 histidinol-phosphate aminotransferase [Phaeovulum vinaykumarii]SOB91365.1 histidinol-phosphate aminotransferase [Phaeovulum vinaykumarii]
MTQAAPTPAPGPRYTRLVAELPASVPFVGPEAQERAAGRPFRARLGANENGFGPSPRAIAAMAEAAAGAWMYGDSLSHDLRNALAAHHGCAPENVIVGEGIDGLLGNLVRLVVAPGDRVVTSAGAYPTFNYHVAGFGGELVCVPYRGDAEDPQALIARAAAADAKLVYISNPDNPMASHHGPQVILDMLAAVPPGCVMVLDEAYIEFAPDGTAPAIDPDDPRVIRMRTFSKGYGLAGARVGYALGAPGLIAAFDKIRNHFGMSRVSQAGALAALHDQDWLAATCAKVARARARIEAIAAENGLGALPSATNFVAIDCGGDGALATRVLHELAARAIFVRKPSVAPQDRCIRVSCGPDAELDALAEALPDALAAARG